MASASDTENVETGDELTKPPFLRRVRIRGYKSIAFCDVPLQPLTILVGRNAAGKSNFLDALALLRDALRFNVPEAVNRHGGFPSILCRSAKSPALSIEIEAAFTDDAASTARYAMTLSANQDGEPISTHEVLCIDDAEGNPVRRFEVREKKAEWWDNGRQFEVREKKAEWWDNGVAAQPSRVEYVPSDHLYLGVISERPFFELANGLRYMGFHNFHPAEMRQPQKQTVGYYLERDGSNLASVVAMLQEKDPERLGRVKAYLAAIAPEIQDFWAVLYGEYATIRFRLRADSESPPLEFDAASMSDGTLRALGALMAAFQFVFPQGRSGVIGIEEPESALHPAATHALVDALQEATQRTQILLTTHSADLLADRDLNPAQVLVVRNRGGRTHITPVDPGSREIIRKELYSLADLQRMDQLDLDEADLQRQERMQAQTGEG